MNKLTYSLSLLALAALLTPSAAMAKKGAPHSYKAVATYSSVSLQWETPEAAKQLRHHDNGDYDGDAGISTSSQRPATIYVASDFAAADLVPGETITSLNYFEYRPVVGLTAIIWEDGEIVRSQAGDLSGYKANQWRTVTFAEPYVIPAGKNIRVGFRIDHGSNLDFVAIMDRGPANPKGDLRSYDGVNWVHNGRGNYLVTANLANDVDEAPDGFNVYVDGTKVNPELLTATSYDLSGQTDGNHTYKVEAVYGSDVYSVEKQLSILGATSYFPGVSTFKATVDGINTTLDWRAPLLRGSNNLLSWHAGEEFSNSIGGTASSNTKVWIKNEFTSADLLSFAGAKIKAIRAQFHEKEALSIIAWVMRDNVIVQYDTVPQSIIDGIEVDQWVSFPLSQPVEIEPGHAYTYGYYMIHTPKKHPVSVDTGIPFGSKSNSFSTSSPNSSNFVKSNPSWRTLESGNIPGNWILAAELEPGSAYGATTASYNVYRNGQLVKEGLTALTYSEEATAPGVYTWAVEAVGSNGNPSEQLTAKATIKVPDSYRTPLIGNSTFDKENSTITFDWGMDVELKHHGDAAYKAGFEEEMSFNWGARFTAAELTEYKNYVIKKLNFIIGQDIPTGFKLQIHNGAGTELSSTDIAAGEVTALGYYTLTLDQPVTISGTEDLIFSYSATVPANCSAIVVDEGPLQTGGAVVRLAGTSNWMNLGTINSTYNKYNIIISAVAAEPASADAPERTVTLGYSGSASDLQRIVLSADALRDGFGIEAEKEITPIAATARMASSNADAYNVYRNGELIATVTDRKYAETVPGYDNFSYQVSAVYNTVWESALSDALVIANTIEQASPAPYDLKIDDTHTLTWQAPEVAPLLTYATADPTSYGVGMTGSGERTSYVMQKFPADSLVANIGNLVSHIRFGLYTTEVNSAAIVIIKDLNIIYSQSIALSDLKAIADGWNEIRLNEPVEIEAGHDYMFGYLLTYANGIKPMLFDAGPAVNDYGNLMSATASHTSWKSLKSLNSSLDGNWRIYTTLMKPADVQRMAPKSAEGLTYNVYRNGTKVKEGLSVTTYLPDWNNDESNIFTVTAVSNGVESAHSNEVGVEHAGVNGVDADAALYYDAAAATLVSDAAGTLYDVSGCRIAVVAAGNSSMSHLARGTYLFRTIDGRTLKFMK